MENTRELFRGIYDFEIRDRFCLYEAGFWDETYARWRAEGLPDVELAPIFGLGESAKNVNTELNVLGPCYLPINYHPIPSYEGVVEENEAEGTRIVRDAWGTLQRCSTKGASLPQYLDWPVKTIADWEAYKTRFDGPAEERLPQPWPDYARRIREQQYGLVMPHVIGMFAFPREILGVENLLMLFCTDPELIERMLDDRLEFIFRVYEQPIRDTNPDLAFIWEDMSFKNGPLISPEMCEAYLLPRYKKLVGFFHDLGIRRIVVDSDGDVSSLIPIWHEAGINGMMPFEVRAGNDVGQLAKQWPDMIFFGGIDKHEIAKGGPEADAELARRLDSVYGRGGYIGGLDHWVPPDISLHDYMHYRDRLLAYRGPGNAIGPR